MCPPDASGIFFSPGRPIVHGITQWLPATPAETEALPHEGAHSLWFPAGLRKSLIVVAKDSGGDTLLTIVLTSKNNRQLTIPL